MAWFSWRWFGFFSRTEGVKKPDALVTMRLEDMARMHPAQDDTHVCSTCGQRVGIYPSGQRALRQWPKMRVICQVCACARPAELIDNMPAADFDTIMQERRESRDVGRG
jgi:hypothetical protein